MNCTDPIALIVYLVRWMMWLAVGTPTDIVWQAVRSVAVRCSQGPLG